MGLVFQPWTAEDLEYAWRHAFAYADSFVSTDDAAEYANHYSRLAAAEEDMNHWPDHGPTFADWRA